MEVGTVLSVPVIEEWESDSNRGGKRKREIC